ncbi:MAG: GNAT family N-acetyltransferase [Myxococcales bacterium]|nr:GNAT family N-acetyltransferase [Myxococcales bacterium]
MPLAVWMPRPARAADVEFIAAVDLHVDELTGETYHLGWGEDERAAHRQRMADFVRRDDRLACIVEADDAEGDDPRVGLLLARFRELTREPDDAFTRVFTETLWPALPPGWAPRDGRFAEVFQLWVRQSHRRRGLASRLKRYLELVARARGLELLYTHTRATNVHVVELNEKLGYRVFRVGPLWDELDRVSLAKRLAR